MFHQDFPEITPVLGTGNSEQLDDISTYKIILLMVQKSS